jgi:hypothetical protein
MSGTGSFSTSYPAGGGRHQGHHLSVDLDDGDVQRYLLVDGLTEDHTTDQRHPHQAKRHAAAQYTN